MFTNDSPNHCPITGSKVRWKDPGDNVVKDYLGNQVRINGNNLEIDTNTPDKNTYYVLVYTASGRFSDREYDVRVCGDEIVGLHNSPPAIYYTFQKNMSPLHQTPLDVRNFFTDETRCPLLNFANGGYILETLSGSTYSTYTGPIATILSTYMLSVDTSQSVR